jgi:2-polyprenyl-3-methyl-5-hydroxy-6-metoxy-1,4-benzoquinol methylase
MNNSQLLTSKEFWDAEWCVDLEVLRNISKYRSRQPPIRLISQLINQHADMPLVCELGAAPGTNLLALSILNENCRFLGIDYSQIGISTARALLRNISYSSEFIEVDLTASAPFKSSQLLRSSDLVFSMGLIEHFTDPSHIIELHTQLCKAEGDIVLFIPNIVGIYRLWNDIFDSEVRRSHNYSIMSTSALVKLFDAKDLTLLNCGYLGSFDIGLLSHNNQLIARVIHSALYRSRNLWMPLVSLLTKNTRFFSPYIYAHAKVTR